ncbi:MAG: glycosyltransferase family 1 protein [Ktedonobacteraceae bacterium]
MKIGINAHFFKYPSTGIGQYLLHLLNTMLEIDQGNEYCILDAGSSAPPGFRHAQQHSIHPVPAWAAHNSHIAQLVWEQWTCPSAAREAQVDVVHNPYFASPLLPRVPTVITIPDLIHFRVPQYLQGWSKKAYMQINMRASARATMIITLSEHAKQDIIDLTNIPAERIQVIYIAAGDEFYPLRDPALLANVRARYGLGERYVFYLGGLDRRKNVLQLVRAFAQLCVHIADPDLQLFIAGDPDSYAGKEALFPDPRPVAAALGITDRVVCRFVEEQDKAALYSGAAVFVFPSLYEGFGLTPLEAMKCGAPVICSNRASLPEVVGDAAVSLDPQDTQALVAAMYAVLTQSTLRADLCARSLRQAALFSWQKTAEQTIAVYEEVFAQRSSLSKAWSRP